MKLLRDYQKEAVEKICNFFNTNMNKAKIYISPGFGKTAIIISAVNTLLKDKGNMSVAILTAKRVICEQIKYAFLEENIDYRVALHICELTEEKILITTYQDVIKNQLGLEQFDLIICDEAQFVKHESYFNLLIERNTKFLGILQNTESSEGWFYDSECLFSYSVGDAIKDGYDVYVGEQKFIQGFLIHLLDYQGYKDVIKEVEISNGQNNELRADLMAKKDNKTVVIEVKSYRSLYNSKAILNNALKQVLKYKYLLLQNNKDEEFSFIITLPCEVDEESQNEIYNRFNVIIWDINNLIYLCEGKKELLNLLISCIPYPSLDLKAKKPLNVKREQREVIREETEISLVEIFMKQLENCKPGKSDKSDKKYEIICTEIIKNLFGTEFFRISEQHKTDDKMFRMDLLCSLKGTTEFWKFLISFYHTKFVVFEYKNYSDYISQNLIYITEKYLFPVAECSFYYIKKRI